MLVADFGVYLILALCSAAFVPALFLLAARRSKAKAMREAEHIRSIAQGQDDLLNPLLQYAADPTTESSQCFTGSGVSKDKVLFNCLIGIIRSVVSSNEYFYDELRHSDAAIVLRFASRRGIPIPCLSIKEVITMMENTGRSVHYALYTLESIQEEDAAGAARLAQVYLDLAKGIAHRPLEAAQDREYGFEFISDRLKAIISPEPLPQPTQSVEEILGEIREARRVLQDALDQIAAANLDPRRALLEVADSATFDEVRAAYKAKVRLWHPDKLSGMAPELQQLANERLASLNEAYQSILTGRN